MSTENPNRGGKLVRILGPVALALFGVIAALLLGEWLLSVAAPPLRYYVWAPNMRTFFQPIPGVMPGVSDESLVSTNELGIRGEPLTRQHTYRILALGGSTTECLFLDDSETWTSLLQEGLNAFQKEKKVWVGSVGRSGYTTRHHILQMQLAVPQYAIDAVVLLVGGNDFLMRLRRDVEYRPLWLEPPGYKALLLRHAFALMPHQGAGQSFFERTHTWRVISRLIDRWQAAPIDPDSIQRRDAINYDRWRAARRAVSKKREVLPDLALALAEYRRNLNRIINIAERRRIRVILLTQPTIWQAEMPEELDSLLWMGAVKNFPIATEYYSTSALATGMAAFNSLLLSVCQARGAECVDMASALPRDATVFYDDVHFTENGARLLAETLVRYISAREPFHSRPGAPPPEP